MSGVHITALVACVISVSVIVELLRRRQLRDKFAAVWLAVCVPMIVFAIAPSLFNRLAHALGVINPPDLLTVSASLFLLIVCVYLSWEVGRLENKTRVLAEEVALLRKEIRDQTGGGVRPANPGYAPRRPTPEASRVPSPPR